jgi:hypothetical protein
MQLNVIPRHLINCTDNMLQIRVFHNVNVCICLNEQRGQSESKQYLLCPLVHAKNFLSFFYPVCAQYRALC